MLLRRLRNLWRLSAYKVEGEPEIRVENSKPHYMKLITKGPMLVKDIPTVKHKLATIIPEEKQNILLEEINERETS